MNVHPFAQRPQEVREIVATARHIETAGPPVLRIAAGLLASGLRFVALHHRRTVALAIAELALRDVSRGTPRAANSRSPE